MLHGTVLAVLGSEGCYDCHNVVIGLVLDYECIHFLCVNVVLSYHYAS